MEWGLLLGGDWGQNAAILEHEDRIARMRRSLAQTWGKDMDQDAQIAALWRENQDLKVGVASLVRLLLAKGVVSEDEVGELVEVLERTEPVTPMSPFDQISADEAATEDLARLREAVQEKWKRK
jgi:hypothetical protein